MSFDMDAGTITAGGVIGNTRNANTVGSLMYGPLWNFDASTEITVCSDLNKADSIGCAIYNLKVAYSTIPWTVSSDFGAKGFPFGSL